MNVTNLSIYLDELEKTSSRNQIIRLLSELLSKLNKNEIDKAVYMMLGNLAPGYEGVVFGLADKMIERSILKAYGSDMEEVRKRYKQTGDLGLTAESFATKTHSNISVKILHKRLHEIASVEGEGSVDRKIELFARLLSALDPLSARFVTRIPAGKLRLGFSDKSLIDALCLFGGSDKSKKIYITRAYEVYPDIGNIAREIKVNGIDSLRNVTPKIGVPVMPMLPQRLKSTTKMVEKMGKVGVEPKFDGLRAQIHFRRGGVVRVFTRNLNDITGMFPEVNEIGKHINAREAILDSEAVGLKADLAGYVDFQTTMNRRRKHDIAQSAINTPLRFQVFDVMYKNGENLMNECYEKRREILSVLFKENNYFVVDSVVYTEDPAVIRDMHRELVTKGLEGVLVKNAKSRYVPGRTGWRWVKMKEVEEAKGKLADTIDAVIMGFTSGKGKRASFGVGQFLAGIIDNGRFVTITKVGTGIKDDQFKELNERLSLISTRSMPKEYLVHKDLTPDTWVEPRIVVELAADEITKSPKHSAHLALRFPRLVKFRDDKSPEQATSLGEIKKLYKLQKA